MKKLLALAVVVMSTSLYAVNINAGNSMGQESAPARSPEGLRDSRVDRMDRRTDNYEMNDRRLNDSISTGQSATKRTKNVETPSARPAVSERCIDRAGYSYSRNDSGYAACVNQSSKMMRPR